MLGLGYPGGPIVQEYSLKGDSSRFELPIPLSQSPKIEFSYSGLKMQLDFMWKNLKIVKRELLNKINMIFVHLSKNSSWPYYAKLKSNLNKNTKNFAIVGGASANIYLRAQIDEVM